MPRCMISTSPEERSASRYFARRAMPVTVLPSRRPRKSAASGQRRSPRLTSTLVKRAPSMAGSRPRRTVSTSGSSGIHERSLMRRKANRDGAAHGLGHGFGHGFGHGLERLGSLGHRPPPWRFVAPREQPRYR